jgi:hypothetical protein
MTCSRRVNYFYRGSLPQHDDAAHGGPVAGKNTYAWSHLALAPHPVQPDRWMFSIGWSKDDRGDPVQLLRDTANRPNPSQLTAASGPIVYPLWNWTMNPGPINDAYLPIGYDVVPTSVQGLAAVQVNDDGTLTIEVAPGVQDPSRFTGFTGARHVYRR